MLALWFNAERFELGGETFSPLVFLLSALAFLLYQRVNPDTVCIVKA